TAGSDTRPPSHCRLRAGQWRDHDRRPGRPRVLRAAFRLGQLACDQSHLVFPRHGRGKSARGDGWRSSGVTLMKNWRELAGMALAVIAATLFAACTSTPQASRAEDADAKAFQTHPSASTIYVYRSPFNYYDYDSVLYINGRLVGRTLPGAYFRIDTVPGRHVLHGTG